MKNTASTQVEISTVYITHQGRQLNVAPFFDLIDCTSMTSLAKSLDDIMFILVKNQANPEELCPSVFYDFYFKLSLLRDACNASEQGI